MARKYSEPWNMARKYLGSFAQGEVPEVGDPGLADPIATAIIITVI